MLNYAILIFAITAVGGLVLAAHVLRRQFAPWTVSILHALLGASGTGLLLVQIWHGQAAQRVLAACALFVLVALVGLVLLRCHWRSKLPPVALVLLHAGLALLAFLTLLGFVL